MLIQTKDWDKRNVWPLPGGELAVRPTLVNVANSVASSGKKHLAGFSIKNPRTEESLYYVLSDVAGNLVLFIFPEDWKWTNTGFTSDALSEKILASSVSGLISTTQKWGFSYAIVEDEILICSPYMDTYWGVVGGKLQQAQKVASVNPNTSNLDIPRGVCVSWAGRAVIASQEALYFSDALSPRTFVAENIVNPPGGTIYGLHVNGNGALIICTATGVYALPEEAAASGQIVMGVFSKLTDYETVAYDSTCSFKGRVYGLTKKGYRLIDSQEGHEQELSEIGSDFWDEPRIQFSDYRLGRLFSDGESILFGISKYLCRILPGFHSWWYAFSGEPNFILRGVLFESSGEPVYLMYDGPAYFCGNKGATVKGTVVGKLLLDPSASPVLRHLEFVSDSYATYTVHVNDSTKTKAGVAVSPLVGTDTWTGGNTYIESSKRSRQLNWATRGDNINIGIDVLHFPNKLPLTLSLVFKGPGKKRPDA